MRSLGNLVFAIAVAVILLWLLFKLLGLAFHLIFLVVAIGLGVLFYLVVEKLVGRGR